jgi:UDP-N-acetylglucosamine--N-acetylmuramyl-(pentapeptide) pyrophosphoryl-undecaprenol N-acetylglucosamine transferase
MNKPFKIIIAGGKTGGHLFPGISIAQALERINREGISNSSVDVLFVGTDAPFETKTLKKYRFAHKSISSKPIKGGNLIAKALSICVLLVSLVQSMLIMKSFKPDFVLGVGGFSSFAVVLAARGFGIPTAIQEQNAFPGLTNRLLARFAATIFTSFKETKGFELNPKVKYVGNPVRKIDKSESTDNLAENLIDNFDPKKATILVTGGSQGATSINNAFMDAMALMKNTERFNIIHQTGINDEIQIQQRYKDLKIKVTARAFFHNMPQLLNTADLAIARAGAGTIFELCDVGLPAILVPFPHAADDHQTFNANALVKNDAALMIKDHELTGEILKDTLEDLMENNAKRGHMAEMMESLAMPNADEKIARHILNKTEKLKTKDIKA